MEKGFSREDTRAVKGIAAILLLIYHLWPFAERFPTGFSWRPLFGLLDPKWIECMGWGAYIMMYVFFFLGGYGLYCRIAGGAKLHDALLRLYTNYWRIFLIFIPVAFLFFSHQPGDFMANTALCNIYSRFSAGEFALNFLGLDCSYNREWWFLTAYAAAMVTGYGLILATEKVKSFWADGLIVLGLDVLIHCLPTLGFFAPFSGSPVFSALFNGNAVPFYMGIVFAKHDALSAMRGIMARYSKAAKILISLFGLLLIYLIRGTDAVTYDCDTILAPFFTVLCITLLDFLPPVKKALCYVGGRCNDIWLIHPFYCIYFYPVRRLVFCTREPLLSLLILLGLCLVSSELVERFYKLLKKIGGRKHEV